MSANGSTIVVVVDGGHVWRKVNNGPFASVATACPEVLCTQWHPIVRFAVSSAEVGVSADGTTVAFGARYSSLRPGTSTLACSDVHGVYVWRETTQKTVRITPNDYRGCAETFYWNPRVSADGTTFTVAGHYKALSGTEKDMRQLPILPGKFYMSGEGMSISGNGRIVTFSGGNSKATGDNTLQTWAYDRWTDVFTPLSTSANSPYGMYPGISSVPAINDAGTYVAWVGIDTAQPGTHFLSTVVSRPITAN